MEAWNDAWREWDADIEEVIEEGRDQVLIIARVHGEGAASGIRLDAWGAVRYTFRDGRILVWRAPSIRTENVRSMPSKRPGYRSRKWAPGKCV